MRVCMAENNGQRERERERERERGGGGGGGWERQKPEGFNQLPTKTQNSWAKNAHGRLILTTFMGDAITMNT